MYMYKYTRKGVCDHVRKGGEKGEATKREPYANSPFPLGEGMQKHSDSYRKEAYTS